ncbi:hypothetical protein JOB18_023882 [Solea senegalensis]|uniref:Uncharacterized protein n=1 Tax=Solea senegalensis TaxID=28829 RepID=A0AAV6R4I8_SOLSE|nr:hypothetical protein JOB18_023882 [Solea senegalensis]
MEACRPTGAFVMMMMMMRRRGGACCSGHFTVTLLFRLHTFGSGVYFSFLLIPHHKVNSPGDTEQSVTDKTLCLSEEFRSTAGTQVTSTGPQTLQKAEGERDFGLQLRAEPINIDICGQSRHHTEGPDAHFLHRW